MNQPGNIRLAIHTENAGGFSPRWVSYCQQQNIDYEIVNCYRWDAIEILRQFDGLLWNFHHLNPTDLLMARHVMTSAECMGLKVFPNWSMAWHFDDKLAQKYLLEAVGAPTPTTYAFFDEREALDWLRTAQYPLVWKLRRGAGSHNVGLVRHFEDGRRYCKKAFGRGFIPIPRYFTDPGMRIRKLKGSGEVFKKLSRVPRAFLNRLATRRKATRERGYLILQQFIPDNTTDTRISVIGDRAFGFVRGVREGDFRASGSGSVSFDRTQIDPECVRIAFEISDAIGAQSIAFDFVEDGQGKRYVVEISYGYVPDYVNSCGGYWDRQLEWHEGDYWPEHLIIEDLIASIANSRASTSNERSVTTTGPAT